MKYLIITLCIVCASFSVQASESPQCNQQIVEKSVIEMCFLPGAPFQHNVYMLKANNIMIFALVDDYVENVRLEHTIPEGFVLEFPLSKQGKKSVIIKGGCVPESKNGLEIARVCNFFWGKHQVVKDIRFESN